MKGLVLAGGAGTRLHPITRGASKQLLPVYDKPMVYYPISLLMLAGIREILLITTPSDQLAFRHLLGDGHGWGVDIRYATQERPEGIAQALLIGREFLDGEGCALVLGDNLLYGSGLSSMLQQAANNPGATLFAYQVQDPERYGVVVLSSDGTPTAILEKPRPAPSNWAVTGLYFYDHHAPGFAAELSPSSRGELEITDVNRRYLEMGDVTVEQLGRGFAWLDAGTHDSLLEASSFVQTIEKRQGLKVGCPEEIAYRMGFIGREQLLSLAEEHDKNAYGAYLRSVADAPRSV